MPLIRPNLLKNFFKVLTLLNRRKCFPAALRTNTLLLRHTTNMVGLLCKKKKKNCRAKYSIVLRFYCELGFGLSSFELGNSMIFMRFITVVPCNTSLIPSFDSDFRYIYFKSCIRIILFSATI